MADTAEHEGEADTERCLALGLEAYFS